jgi:hypothetical protein
MRTMDRCVDEDMYVALLFAVTNADAKWDLKLDNRNGPPQPPSHYNGC